MMFDQSNIFKKRQESKYVFLSMYLVSYVGVTSFWYSKPLPPFYFSSATLLFAGRLAANKTPMITRLVTFAATPSKNEIV